MGCVKKHLQSFQMRMSAMMEVIHVHLMPHVQMKLTVTLVIAKMVLVAMVPFAKVELD